jgi:cell division initiation protein
MITPLDIENKKFYKQMVNGYNVEEVDEFLDELMIDYEKLYKENIELKKNAEELHNDVGQYKDIESTLQNTLVIAQKTADEVKKTAEKQAEQIIKDAELTAKEKTAGIENEIMLKEKELAEVKKKFEVYKAKMESLLISQLELIKDITEE